MNGTLQIADKEVTFMAKREMPIVNESAEEKKDVINNEEKKEVKETKPNKKSSIAKGK